MSHHQYVPLISLFLLCTFSLNGCTQPPASESPNPMVEEKTTPATLPAKVPVITVTKMQMNPTAVAVNAFATSLYAQLKSQPGNLFFSPYSLSSALTMTYAGAKGKTKEEMAKVLHLGANESVIHNGFGELERSLVSKTTYQLDLANAIWVQQRKVFLAAEFVELLQEAYHLGLKTADFETAAAQEILRINAWVAGKTANKIPKLLNSGMLTSQTQLVLTNAIYFKGKWQLPFNPEETKPLSFLKLDGVEVKVPTMYQKETFGYLEREEVQMIELPYKTSESSPGLSMVILLPTKTDGVGLSKVEEKLEDYLRLQSDLKPLKVSVYLPKFKVEAAFQLQEALQQMGMKVAFEPHQADFSGMTGKPELAISAVVHQAFAEVNEEGTEAAAATAVVGSRGRSLVFRADHPFVFWIRENRAGTVLFLGKVVNPQ